MKALMDALVIGPAEGGLAMVTRGLGARFLLDSDASDGRFSVVEHPLAPGYLAAPLHRHANEDEFSFVLEGEIGAQVGDQVLHASAGMLLVKPRGIWHTFWNPGPRPARLLEIISPGGFERYFERIGQFFPENGPPDFAGFLSLCAEFSLEMDMDSVPGLLERHRLTAI